MGFFGWVVLLYIVTALICWSVFGRRFLFAKDIRRPKNVDMFDAFPPVVAIVLLGWAISLLNPTRFVRTVGKSVLWPVTLWRWFNRSSVASDSAPSTPAGLSVQSGRAAPFAASPPAAPGWDMHSAGGSDAMAVPPAQSKPVRPSAPLPRPSVEKHVGPAPAWGTAPPWGAPGTPLWGAPGGAGPMPASPQGSAPRVTEAPPPLPPRGPSPGRHSNF